VLSDLMARITRARLHLCRLETLISQRRPKACPCQLASSGFRRRRHAMFTAAVGAGAAGLEEQQRRQRIKAATVSDSRRRTVKPENAYHSAWVVVFIAILARRPTETLTHDTSSILTAFGVAGTARAGAPFRRPRTKGPRKSLCFRCLCFRYPRLQLFGYWIFASCRP
jgi:hypothetical protein